MLKTIDFDSLPAQESAQHELRCFGVMLGGKDTPMAWRCVLNARHMDGDLRHSFGSMGTRQSDFEWTPRAGGRAAIVSLHSPRAHVPEDIDEQDWDMWSTAHTRTRHRWENVTLRMAL